MHQTKYKRTFRSQILRQLLSEIIKSNPGTYYQSTSQLSDWLKPLAGKKWWGKEIEISKIS
jgi:hypothetical protein